MNNLFFTMDKAILFFIILSLFSCNSGIHSDAKNKEDKSDIILDNGPIMTCHYLFIQKARLNSKKINLSDTVVLEVGDFISVYRNESSRKRDSIYLKQISAVTAEKVISVEDISAFRKITEGLLNEISIVDRKNIESELIYKDRKNNAVYTLDSE